MSSPNAGSDGALRVLNAAVPAERKAWSAAWLETASQSPYAHPAVAQIAAAPGDSLLCALLRSDHGNVLYPFVLRPLDGGESDIVSPYGYAGALFWGAGEPSALAARFWRAFDGWAATRRVVSEFVRGAITDDVLAHPGPPRPRTTGFVRDLTCADEELWTGAEAKVRRNARRATASGVSVRVDREGALAKDFHRIYSATMAERGAAAWYRFGPELFARLGDELRERTVYVAAVHEGRPISMDLVLLGRDTGYYFLGGTERVHSALRPNDLVKLTVMSWLRSRGYRRYVLGGGIEPGDGLERYKRGFAPAGATPFSTHERVVNAESYAARTRAHAARLAAGGAGPDPGFFPAYRAPGREGAA